jgi:hypothetical protein
MVYMLKSPDKAEHIVCREAFAQAWGISVYRLKEISKALKLSEHRRVLSTHHRKLTDSTLMDFNYSETEDIFRINTGLAGKINLLAVLACNLNYRSRDD